MQISFLRQIVLYFIVPFFSLCYGSDAYAKPYSPYSELWKRVDSLLLLQQPESALKNLDVIYSNAIQDGNQIQQIKAFVGIQHVKSETGDQANPSPFKIWEMELSGLSPENQSVLLAYKGEFMISVLNRERSEVFRRPKGTARPEDILTWDINYFKDRIDSCFLRSLNNHKLLAKISSRNYSALLDTVELAWQYRPTLLDIVAAEALKFYKNDGFDLSPVPFAWAGDALSFSYPFSPKNTNSGRYDSRVFEIFRLLEEYHKINNENDALLYLQLERLDYIHQHSSQGTKDELYIDALKSLAIQIGDHPFKANVLGKQADVLSAMAYRYDPSIPASEIFRFKNSEAARIYEAVISQYPGSPAGIRSANKLRQLQAPHLQMNVENITRSGFPFTVLAQYRNLTVIKARLSRINHSEYLALLKSGSQYMQNNDHNYESSTLVSETDYKLIPDVDLRQHSTELIFSKLTSGLYFIELQGITDRDTCSSGALFTVSGITFTEQDGIFNVMNIENGIPVKAAEIEIFKQNNTGWSTSKFKTSADGFIKSPAVSNLVQISYQKDTITTRWYINKYRDFVSDVPDRLYLFTDRSIYRPGQTVLFKGIMINKDGDKAKSIENRSVEVILQNSNNQNIDTLTLTTNGHGTISGRFNIPSGGLPGEFRLSSTHGELKFRVEEYRRPGFKIEYDDLKGEYRLNSKVEVSGNVVSFSGVPLKNVSGKYRVSRSLVWVWRPWGEPEQIDEGTFTTDGDGKYRFSFLAKPDEKYTQLLKFPSRFDIQTEITDITGETQVASKSVQIAKEALTASISGPAILDIASDSIQKNFKITFQIRNSDNQEIKSTGKIELIRIESPAKPLRKRLWANPDRPIYSKAQWDRLYPGNQYGEEIQPVNYAVDKIIQTIDFDSNRQQVTLLNASGLQQGYYKVRLTTADKFGSVVRAEHLVRVFNSSKKDFSFPENSWVNLSGNKVLPGENIELLLGNFGTQFWKVLVYHREDTVKVFNSLIDRSMSNITIPVLTAHQGGLTIRISSISLGRVYFEVFNVEVPWVQKTLKVSVEEFPEIVVPGKEVSWNVKVVDANGKPVKAEIAGVVYDASLDKILPHNWQLNIWENIHYYPRLRFPQDIGYGIGQCTQPEWINEKQEILPEFHKIIDYQVIMNQRQETSFLIRGGSKRGTSPESLMAFGTMKKSSLVGNAAIVQDAVTRESDTSLEDKPIEIRSDFRETAWFDARVETDENGGAEVRFNLPGSVTEWKFMALAHTPDGLSGTITYKFVTRKPLIVEPFPTRFLTVGDQVTLPVKVTNLSGKSLDLDLFMQLTNIETGEKTEAATRMEKLILADRKAEAVSWKLVAPATPGLYTIKITARGGEFTDGFESVLPVEPDRTWITEAKAFTIKPGNSYQLKFSQVGGANQINDGKWNFALMTNPIGLILDALPQLMGDESYTISGTSSRLTGTLILRKILADHPEIAKELEFQRQKLLTSPDSFKTRLEKGEQFTNLKLNETPWLRESNYEKEKLAKFNTDTIKSTIKEAIEQLKVAQLSDGGFAWCPGMESSEWITSRILTDIAQMRSKNLLTGTEKQVISAIALKAVKYLDHKIMVSFRQLKDKDKINYQPSGNIFDYLHARGTFKEIEFASGVVEAYNFYLEKASKNWNKSGIWQQVQLAFVLKRENSNPKLLRTIIQSLRERAIKNEETGMYWKQRRGVYFYREPDIALQSMIIELFYEINAPAADIDALKLWLLQQKRTHAWESTFATAQAINALNSGQNIIPGNQPLPELFLDGKKILPEGNTGIDGFIQSSIKPGDLNADSKLEIRNPGKNIIFGGLYHGFFKQVNDTTGSGSSLKIKKEIFKLEKSAHGDSLVSNLSESLPGDLLMIRLVIDNDRDLGFITLDDQRPAGTEPLKQLSSYEYNGGLWYYRVTTDTGTRFFIGNLPKGRFVLEYPIRVSHKGTFSGGRATIQSSFAPEFGANHSPGKLSFEAK